MYNKEFKERFIEESGIIDSTAKTYRYILGKAEPTETALNKDLFDFTPYECDQFINQFSRRSVQSVYVIITVCKTYVDFAIKNLMLADWTDNYFASISGISSVESYVDKTSEQYQYIDVKTLRELQGMLINAQDVVLTELAHIGVNGRQASELLNLKVNDVVVEYQDGFFKKGYIQLENRKIEITEETYNIINEAIEQTDYIKGNGELGTYVKAESMPICKSDYVLRNAGKDRGEVGYPSLQMKFNRLKKYMGNNYLNLSYFWQSGMLNMLRVVKEEKGYLEDKDFEKVHKVFGYTAPIQQTKIRFRNLL